MSLTAVLVIGTICVNTAGCSDASLAEQAAATTSPKPTGAAVPPVTTAVVLPPAPVPEPTPEERARAAVDAAMRDACSAGTQAQSAETAGEVIELADVALRAIDRLPADGRRTYARDRAALVTARAAAVRENARCERQIALNDRCHERCSIVGEYRSYDWMDRCAEYCDARAPLCADQRDSWTAAGRPQSGVAVPSLRLCAPAPSTAVANPPPERGRGDHRPVRERPRRSVSDDEFE